ncbi:MAG: hypothetical protein KGV44_12425 [Flavobacteriaceae bacterium]|nr:hypothetical protein [Flavobacteriaceae bacterium]MBS9768324.1 hypothetical protein [Flavobacteriaceae bacterium]
MGRPKGSKKYGGRQKGTPNKTTESTRQWLKMFLDENQKQIEEDFRALEPKERLQVFERLLQYTLPKMQSVSANIDLNVLSDDQLNTIIEEITKDVE